MRTPEINMSRNNKSIVRVYFNMYIIGNDKIFVHPDAKIFIRFLHKENIYQTFFLNFFIRDHFWDDEHRSCYSYAQYIEEAFPWDYTPEGYDFWHNINDKWKAYHSDSIGY